MTFDTLYAYFEQIMFWFGTVVGAASVIMKATPTQKDDAVLAHFLKIVEFFSIFDAKIKEAKRDDE